MDESVSPVPDPAAPAPLAASRVPGTNRTVASLALLIGLLALALASYLVLRAAELQEHIAQEHAEALARDQRNAELERRIGALERQWAQVQADADVGAGLLSDAELRRRREALALLDVERLVEQTQLQLRLGAATGVAIDALAAADARLGRLASATAVRVQTALRHDLARLKTAPDVDRDALAARLDPLLAAVDGWRLTADPSHTSLRPSLATAPPSTAAPVPRAADSFGARLRAWLESEFGDLLRIREVDTPDALLLGPLQQQLLRDRFRLGVLDLRQAILARDERMIRGEQTALEALLLRYFDPGQAGVTAAIAQLRATAAAATAGPPPSLDETIGALRAARGANGGSGSGNG